MPSKITTLAQTIHFKNKKKKLYNISPLFQYNYYKHRCRVKNAKKFIDNAPPILHLTNIMNLKNNYIDMSAISGMMRTNTEMLEFFGRLNIFGRKESWNDSHDAQWRYSRLAFMRRAVEAIEKENQYIAKRVLNAQKKINTHLKPLSASVGDFRTPKEILAKYKSEVILPPRCGDQHLLLRPIVYFDMEVVGLYPIGRFIIQLYTEAFPQAALALVRTCKEQKLRKLRLVRAFPNLWAEFELRLDAKDTALAADSHIEYDKRALSKNFKAGTLSFSLKHIDTLRKGILSFALSFRTLSVEMKERVAFGVLIRGKRGLYLLESNGTKNGKPMKKVIATEMGVSSKI
uniref:Peptidyl-prolyl cis-trans isomerase CYP18-3 n=1 Tax=Ceratitis capitata TaxID=7213 RepID=W8C4Q6_CERCA